jgi:hypothetical protein
MLQFYFANKLIANLQFFDYYYILLSISLFKIIFGTTILLYYDKTILQEYKNIWGILWGERNKILILGLPLSAISYIGTYDTDINIITLIMSTSFIISTIVEYFLDNEYSILKLIWVSDRDNKYLSYAILAIGCAFNIYGITMVTKLQNAGPVGIITSVISVILLAINKNYFKKYVKSDTNFIENIDNQKMLLTIFISLIYFCISFICIIYKQYIVGCLMVPLFGFILGGYKLFNPIHRVVPFDNQNQLNIITQYDLTLKNDISLYFIYNVMHIIYMLILLPIAIFIQYLKNPSYKTQYVTSVDILKYSFICSPITIFITNQYKYASINANNFIMTTFTVDSLSLVFSVLIIFYLDNQMSLDVRVIFGLVLITVTTFIIGCVYTKYKPN